MIRRPPRSTQSRSSAASDVYKRQPWQKTHPPQPVELVRAWPPPPPMKLQISPYSGRIRKSILPIDSICMSCMHEVLPSVFQVFERFLLPFFSFWKFSQVIRPRVCADCTFPTVRSFLPSFGLIYFRGVASSFFSSFFFKGFLFGVVVVTHRCRHVSREARAGL